MKTDDAKVFVGYSGIYDLTTAAITTRTKDEQRKAYFFNLDPSALAKASPALKGSSAELLEYPYYDHNLTSKSSDKMEEIFFKTADFIAAHL